VGSRRLGSGQPCEPAEGWCSVVVDEQSRGAPPATRATSAGVVSRRSRTLAALALVLLAVAVASVIAGVVLTRGLLLLVVAVVGAAVVVAVACAWWALTTRRRWKRRLNLLLVALTAVFAVIVVALFSGVFAGYLALLVASTAGYAELALRALSTAAPEEAGVGSPPVRPWLLVNARSGGGKASRLGLVQAAARRGVDVHVLAPGQDTRALAKAAVAAGADTVGVAGGDGSLGAVAAVAVEAGLPFLCIPTGTRNHFAADVGLDRTRPLAALDALDGRERRVDVGTVGGRIFLNNVSLGAYAELVGESSYRDDKMGTARALLPGMLRAERPVLEVGFGLPDGEVCADALLLLVGNNPYLPSPLQAGSRPRLDTGLLQVSVLRARTGSQLAAVLAQVAAGRAGDGTSWRQWTTPAFQVRSPHPAIRAAVDGESTVLPVPLEFGIRSGALRVLVPASRRRGLTALFAPLRWRTARSLWTVARGGSDASPAAQHPEGDSPGNQRHPVRGQPEE
jgi:diacylglycerol kinase family enzyme